MTEFKIHTIESAPAESKEVLEGAVKSFGMVPNLLGVLAEAPQALSAYTALTDLVSQSSFSTVEINVMWLEINVLNECHYCVPAHTAIAKGAKVPDDMIEALRTGAVLQDTKLEELRRFTRKVVFGRGHVSDEDLDSFLGAGYTRQNILEVVLCVAHKTISNYTNHIADTPVDKAFQPFVWQK